MAFREVHAMEIIEVIRRWQAGESARGIARATGVARNSVDKYLRLAKAAGVQQDGEPPGEEVVRQLVAQSRPGPRPGSVAAPGRTMLEERRERIATWLQEERLQLTRVHELLLRDGVAVSYTTLREFARDAGLRQPPTTTLRMAQWPPGEVAEIDFGKLGSIVDVESGKRQVVWALVVVLPYSRHSFTWPMQQQTLEESVAGLEAAWQFFGGVPRRVILDNFPAAIAGADALTPRLTRGFLEYSQARGFIADPARVRRPQDKPHVERNIQYVRERFFKGGSFRNLEDCREQAERWCREIAGVRVHGTTRKLPLEVFATEEQAKSVQLVTRSIEDISSMTAQIFNASKEQSNSTKNIARAIDSIKEMTQEMVNATGRQVRDGSDIKKSVEAVGSLVVGLFDDLEKRREESGEVVRELQVIKEIAG